MGYFGKNHSSRTENFNAKTHPIFRPKFILSLTFFFVFAIFSLQTASADVVSVNAGGNTEIVVNPDLYVEGFFSGIPEEEVAPPVTPPPPGGGGGGPSAANLSLNPIEFNINLAVDTTTERTINITNTGGTQIVVSISQSNLGSHVILENTTVTVNPGQTVTIKVVFVALSEPGIFAGTINIGGRTVFVSLNVKTKLLLFDSNIVVLNEDYKVERGDELRTRVTLIPLGDPERLDVSLFFTIRDYSGNIYLTKSETLLVDRLTNIDRNFDTGALPFGQYVVGLELRYPNGVAPSSAHFEVTRGKGASILGRIILFLISLILIVSIILILVIIWRRRKKKLWERQLDEEISNGAG